MTYRHQNSRKTKFATEPIKDWALAIVTRLQTYAEVSPSGTGLRLWARGTLPLGGRKNGDVEIYSSGRYLTVTGNHLQDTPPTVEPRQSAIDALHREVFAKPTRAEPQASSSTGNGHQPPLDDDTLLEKALAARNGEKFARLWRGDTSDQQGDDSVADAALCGMLTFWTRDALQIDRLFRRSGLYREKWDERHGETTYGARTIAYALSQSTEHWTPGKPSHTAPAKINGSTSRLVKKLEHLLVRELGDVLRDSLRGS